MGLILYILGIAAAVWCVLDIFKSTKLDGVMKLVVALAVLLTSWLGFAVYYFVVRERIQ